MANEVSLTGSLTINKPSVLSSPLGRSVTNLTFNMSGNLVSEGVMSADTAATSIPLGQVSAPHWAFFANKDSVNFVTIRNGSAGADLIKLLAGECAFMPLLNTAVPYAKADTAAVLLEFLVASL